jgi:probable F420-dependent oxidoreductase
MTVPTDDVGAARTIYRELEELGYDRAFSFEAKHDPFLPLAVAAEHTSSIQLGTAIAIAFARTPMTLANVGWDLQTLTGGRFVLGLGTQIRPHVEQRFSMPWSRPAERLREMVLAVRAIWSAWQDGMPLDFRGDFYTHTRMIPAFDPGPNPHGPPPVFTAGVGPRTTAVGGEVADGFLVHPVNTRRSLQELTLPPSTGPRRPTSPSSRCTATATSWGSCRCWPARTAGTTWLDSSTTTSSPPSPWWGSPTASPRRSGNDWPASRTR